MCPQDVSLTWSRGRTRSEGDDNGLPAPERQRNTYGIRGKVHVYVSAHLGAGKVGKY